MSLRKFNFLPILLITLSVNLFAQDQSRSTLEKERNINIDKIEEAEKILEETEKSKDITVGRLNVINKQINNRQGLINNLRRDLKIKSEEISTLRMLISSLKNDLKILNEEYSEMVYYSYKSKSSLDKLTFVFASESYNQMFRRFNYIFQYSKFRKNQIQEINEVSLELQDQEKKFNRAKPKAKKSSK